MFRHIIYIAIFFLTADKQYSWLFQQLCFYYGGKISFKKVCEKIENNSTLEKVLLVRKRKAEMLQLVGATFDSKVALLRRMRKKNLIILKSLQKKSLAFFVLLVWRCWHLSCQISIESVRKIVICSLSVIIMTVLYLKIFLNIIIICAFIEQ